MASDLETASPRTGDDLLEFWEDPSNAELIKNAVSLESLERSICLKDLIRDHFEDIEDEDIYKVLEEYFPNRHSVVETEVTCTISSSSEVSRNKFLKPAESLPGMSSFEEFQKIMAEKQGLLESEEAQVLEQSDTQDHTTVQGLASEEVSMQEIEVVKEESAKEVIPQEESTSLSDATDGSLGLVVTELLKLSIYASKEDILVVSYKTTQHEEPMHQLQEGTQNITLKASSTVISTDYFEDEENVQNYNQEVFFDGKKETRKTSFSVTLDPKQVGRCR